MTKRDADEGPEGGTGWDLAGPAEDGATRGLPPRRGRPRVLIVDPDRIDGTRLKELLDDSLEVLGEARDVVEAYRLAHDWKPDIALIQLSGLGEMGLDLVRRISDECPGVLPVVVASDKGVATLRHAMQVGAREFLLEPLKREETVASLHHLLRANVDADQVDVPAPRPPGAGIWTFTSASGGVGKSTLVLALADGLLARGLRVAVADLNPLFGDLSFYLDLEPEGPTLGDLVLDYPDGEIPPLATMSYGREHRSGMRIFFCPTDPASSLDIPHSRLIAAVRALAEAFDYVLVDLPPGLHEADLELLDATRYLFVVSDDRVSSVKNLGAYVKLLEELDVGPDRLNPVLIRLWQTDGVRQQVKSVLERLGMASFLEIPHDRLHAEDAILGGEPLTRRSPACPYSRAANDLLADLVGSELRRQHAARRRSGTEAFLARFLGGQE